jgi:hypothetical protein
VTSLFVNLQAYVVWYIDNRVSRVSFSRPAISKWGSIGPSDATDESKSMMAGLHKDADEDDSDEEEEVSEVHELLKMRLSTSKGSKVPISIPILLQQY